MRERLEGIRRLHQKDGRINRIDIAWLIQQAELYEECRADAIRMHNALVFYSNENNYDFDISLLPAPSIESMIIDDYGETARKALGVETIKDSESE